MPTTTLKFKQAGILIGDGGDPETFAPACLLNSTKGIQLSATFSENSVPDCDDDDVPAEILRYAESISLAINGSGKLHQDDQLSWMQWLASGQPKNVQVRLGTAGAPGAVQISTQIVLTDFSINGQSKQLLEADVSLASHGFKASDIAAYT